MTPLHAENGEKGKQYIWQKAAVSPVWRVCELLAIFNEEFLVGAEDEDVVHHGGHGEKEQLELEAHPEEDAACNERQDAAVDGVLRGMELIQLDLQQI